MNRREFLKALLGVGAVIALPVPIAQASPAQVGAAWDRLVQRPWVFYVDESGTILDGHTKEPTSMTHADVFDVRADELRTLDEVRDAILGCDELNEHFEMLAQELIDETEPPLWRYDLPDAERERLWVLADQMRNHPDYPLVLWLHDPDAVEKSRAEIRRWLALPIDEEHVETNMSRAKRFFEVMPRKLLGALGVVIIEGEHPGSSYYAAALRGNIDTANAVAAERALPFRFAREE